MAGAGAARRDKAQNFGFVELDGLGRGEVVGRQQDRHLGRNAALHDAAQNAQDALADVAHVGGAGLHVGVVHGGEHGGELVRHVGDGGLGVEFFVGDKVFDGFLVVEVLGHHLVGLKQHGGFVAGLGAGLFGQIAQLLDGAGLRALKAVPFGVGILHGIALDLGGGAAVKIQRAHTHAGRNALALDGDHAGVPLSFYRFGKTNPRPPS